MEKLYFGFNNFPEKKEEPVRVIENSDLDSGTQLELLMIYLGEKPASFFGDSKKRGRVKKEIERVVQELGGDICFDCIEEAENDDILYRIFVGKDIVSLNRLQEAFITGTGEDLGVALGYPKSAARAFQEGKIIEDYSPFFEGLSEEEKQTMQTTMRFRLFGLSSDNYQEEMEVVERLQRLVEEKSPEIYRRIISKD